MGGGSTSSSSSDSLQQEAEKFQLFRLDCPPPPPSSLSKGEKHRHRRHSYPSPPSPSAHFHLRKFEHCPHNLPPLMGFPVRHHPKEGKLRMKPPKHLMKVYKLRMKPPKHLMKVHKLHRKIMKAYRLPKPYWHQMHFPPLEEGIFSAPFCHKHPHHSREAMEGSSVVCKRDFHLHHHPRCHGRYLHLRHPSHPLNKSNAAGGEVAPMEISAEPPVEGGTMPFTSDKPPADEPAPVTQAL